MKSFLVRGLAAVVLAMSMSTAHAFAATEADDAGLPALSREWRGADYQTVAAAIDKGTLALPRLSSGSGAALLGRLTSLQNLELQKNPALPVESRMQDFVTMQAAVVPIMMRYLEAASRGEPVHSELATLLSFMMYMGASCADMTNEYLPTIQKDEKYASRMDGVVKIKSGLTTMLVGAEASLSETRFYSAEDVSLMMEAMAVTLPSMKSLLSPDFRAELLRKLETRRNAAKRADDIKNLDRMLAELRA